ncbi:MAG: hypothetical protein ACR2KJ_03820 [Jatrophihabitans sp.]
MTDLHMKPKELIDFANAADTQAAALAKQLTSVTFDRAAFGQFEEAVDLADALNNQLKEVQARLYSSMGILQQLAGAARTAASMTGMSDADVATTMTNINTSLAAAETALAKAPQGPEPVSHGGARPI